MPNTRRIHYPQHTRRYGAEKAHYLKKCVRRSFLGGGVREFPWTVPKQANLHDFSVML